MKTELKQIIKELSEVIEEEKLNITHSELMDFAIRILNSQSINKQKFYPKQDYNKEIKNEFKDYPKTNTFTSKDELPTERQIKAMKRLNLTIPAGATKKEVWKIMKEFKEKNEERP
jgi:hypothetical protein